MNKTTWRTALLSSLAVAVLAATAQCVSAFQLGVSPLRHEFTLGSRPVTRSMKLFNKSGKDIKVAIRVANFDLDEQNRVRELAPTPQSLDQWIIIRPLRFVIKAGETRTIRFAVRPFVQPKQGEHRAIIFVERDGLAQPKAGNFNVGFRFGVAVYANAGTITRRGELKTVKADALGLSFDVKSAGNASVRLSGTYGVWPASAFPDRIAAAAAIERNQFTRSQNYVPKGSAIAGILPSVPVFAGYRRTVRGQFKKKLPPGDYRSLIRGQIAGQPFSRVIAFRVDEQ